MTDGPMNDTVTLVTDRPGFVPLWRDALDKHGFELRVCGFEELGGLALRHQAVVFDAASDELDEDDLLTGVSFARAAGALPWVHSEDDVEDIVEEICFGRITRSDEDVERVARTLARRLDRSRGRRFEFVTVSPRDGDVLAVLGDGESALLKRPVSSEDDGSDIVAISLAEDAMRASLELASGQTFDLHASSVAPRSTGNGAGAQIPIDGARLGARLRELRLEAGLTQAELARRTGIHRPNIARVEAGRATPSLETLARLAGAIGVPTTRVLSED